MTEATFAALMVLVLLWAVASHLLVSINITGALVFLVAGYAVGNPTWGPLTLNVDTPSVHLLPEVMGELLARAVWFLFGPTLVPLALKYFSVSILAYALLSLTFIRVVPTAIALLGKGLNRSSVLFAGWFGPRGPSVSCVRPLGDGGAERVAAGRTDRRGGRTDRVAERGAPGCLCRPARESPRLPAERTRPGRGVPFSTTRTPSRTRRDPHLT